MLSFSTRFIPSYNKILSLHMLEAHNSKWFGIVFVSTPLEGILCEKERWVAEKKTEGDELCVCVHRNESAVNVNWYTYIFIYLYTIRIGAYIYIKYIIPTTHWQNTSATTLKMKYDNGTDTKCVRGAVIIVFLSRRKTISLQFHNAIKLGKLTNVGVLFSVRFYFHFFLSSEWVSEWMNGKASCHQLFAIEPEDLSKILTKKGNEKGIDLKWLC